MLLTTLGKVNGFTPLTRLGKARVKELEIFGP